EYRNFYFSLQIQGVGKQTAHMSRIMVEPLDTYWQNIPKLIVSDYWSYYNSDEKNRKIKFPILNESGKSNIFANSEHWLFDGFYIRPNKISIGYNITQTAISKLSAQQIRVYRNLSAIYSFNNYQKGWDPESTTSGYPITTGIVLGSSIKF